MRADRLVSLLLLLQTRGRMTAHALAAELEVSERTIYRDIDALSLAGIPVYGDPGPAGGYALLDSYRTTLTGLSAGEARALFLLSLPTPLADLGIGQELKAALLKLTAALPAAQRQAEAWVRRRILLDPVWWDNAEPASPHLPAIHRALWQDRRLHIAYSAWSIPVVERLADPYGLVAKAGVWHLVCAYGQGVHVQPVARLLDARPAEETFVRPADFDLADFWARWCAGRGAQRAAYTVTARVAPDFIPALPTYFGEGIRARVAQAGPPDAAGRLTLTLTFESLEEARARILGFGRGVEVLAPFALRRSVLDFAEQTAGLYQEGAPGA